MGIMSKILSAGADRQLKKYKAEVAHICELEPEVKALSDEQLADKTRQFKERLANGETIRDIRDEAFAVTREATLRVLGMRHFDEQLIAALAMDDNMIAEASTGSGKTIACIPVAYLNALEGKGVHVVTVNDYLAERDAEQTGRVHAFLGLTCACVTNTMPQSQRTAAYAAAITYGTNTEFGFDYLRDHMVSSKEQKVQRGRHFAIIDEIDSILIDEARTPLIISGEEQEDLSVYATFAAAVRPLMPDVDFEMDERKRTIATTEEGLTKVEKATGIDIYADTSGKMAGHLMNALKAQFLFHRDKEYVVEDGEIKIVDEYTGRILAGRRYSEGLHQAIEAKEHVEVKQQMMTLATTTLQNYFRAYDKLAGMTGTAATEDSEFRSTYNLAVLQVPDHNPSIRIDHDDKLYVDMDSKVRAITNDVVERHAKGQPILVGTPTVEASERISRELRRRGIAHEVLNAKNHEREAHIVAQAGRLGAVTVATNMAGRGTDIMLGGNPEMLVADEVAASAYDTELEVPQEELDAMLARARAACASNGDKVREAGGLCIIGSERHESRRVDNQLRGRSGRQGDPGETVFYLSFEDDLIRLFGDEKTARSAESLRKAGLGVDEPIQMRTMTRLVATAQHRVEEVHAESRKKTLEYDDVVNEQRNTIYAERDRIVDDGDVLAEIADIARAVAEDKVDEATSYDGTLDTDFLETWFRETTEGSIVVPDTPDEAVEEITKSMVELVNFKAEELGDANAKRITNRIMLHVMDTRWRTYIQELDYLRDGIGLRGFGQRDPLVEYKREAYEGFGALVAHIYEDLIRILLHVEIRMAA